MEKFVFKHQVNNRGLYADICFEVKIDTTKPSNLIVEYNADKHWEIICLAGIRIFYDYYIRQKQGSLHITVISIDWLPIDTNNLIVMYSIVKGLSEILNLNISKLNFDSSSEVFIFPESRSVVK